MTQNATTYGPYALPNRVYYETVDQSPMAIIITDPQGIILYANHSFCETTGFPLTQVQGQHTRMLSAGKTPTCIYGELWKALLQQEVWSGRLVNRRADGSHYLAEVTVTPVIGPEGQTTHYLGMHRDITRLQRLHQDLDNERTLTDSILRSTPVATLLLDRNGTHRFRNPAFEALCKRLRCQQEDLLAVLANRLGLELSDCPEFADLEIRYDIPGIGTPRWLSCSGSALKLWQSDESFNQELAHDCVLLTLSDITDLKIQQEEIRVASLMARLAENELVYAMREALSGAIYQLQRPLNIIGAATAIQNRRGQDSDPLADALNEVSRACEQAIDTLNHALPAAPRKRKMPVHLNELLREILTLYTERLLADGVIVDWQPCNSLPSILGDEVSLANLFKQLLDNALNAMTDGKVRDRELGIITDRLSDGVRVTVRDNGPGIARNIERKVFQPFFSKHPHRGGMGLTLVQDVANDHGATVEIDRHNPSGCHFTLTFPALAEM